MGEPARNNSPQQHDPEGQEPAELEPEEQVVVNEEEDTHEEYSPERKEFMIRLERASSDQMVGLAILNKGHRCQVYSVKPKGVVDYWNKANSTIWMVGSSTAGQLVISSVCQCAVRNQHQTELSAVTNAAWGGGSSVVVKTG